MFSVCNSACKLFLRGQAFRPTYREEAIIQSYFDTPNLALTATATKTIQQDIYIVLGLDANHTKVISELPDRFVS